MRIMKKIGMPSYGELVVCKITKIHPNSAFAKLIEYDKTGMIHVSEVASRWVRNIREFLKENQYVICRVMKIEGDHILLSVKRVARDQANRKLSEFKRERKAEKMLELVGKEKGKSLEEVYKEIGHRLQDSFGSLSKSFEIALKSPELLKSKGIPHNWIDSLIKIAKKSYVEKTYEIKARLKLVCYRPDGINVIKKALSRVRDSKYIDVKYISAPVYVLTGQGNDHKKLEADVEAVAEEIIKEINQNQGEASFELVK